MDSLLLDEDESKSTARLLRQAASFLLHTTLAIGVWLALMFAGYAVHPAEISQPVILVFSLLPFRSSQASPSTVSVGTKWRPQSGSWASAGS